MNETKNAKNPSAAPVKKGGGFGMGFLVASAIFLVILMLAGLIFGGWWYYKKYIKKSVQKIQQQTQSQAQNQIGQPMAETQSSETEYVNNTFGFRLKMTPAWKDYKTKEEPIGGDFEVSRVGFFLPTAQKKGWESPDMPGYFNLFVISVYVKDSWDEAFQANGGSMPMGEEIGRNNYNVFVWTHFNGDPPSDVSEQAILDMQAVVDSIEVWNVDETNAGVTAPETITPQTTTQSCSFPNGDIQYWWNTVSQSVRDCYISKYGDPGL